MSFDFSPDAIVLGIETSCDETAAALVRVDKTILSNVVLSQIAEHTPYGGVVPEIAARAHMMHLEQVIDNCMKQANLTFADITGVAATCGPGLIGGVIVGAMAGKTIASVHQKSFIAVNHLEGHALTARLTHEVEFPYLLLLVSGGHCQFLLCRGIGDYELLGQTLDDALGEAFDKCAKMLGLPFPGGPQVEKCAKNGNPNAYPFTVPMQGRPNCDFSFSGLKTAVRTTIQEITRTQPLTSQHINDICASFQRVALDSVIDRLHHAIHQFKFRSPNGNTLVVAGGVAANHYLRTRLQYVTDHAKLTLIVPPANLCTDNAAMIAWAGIEYLKQGKVSSLDIEPRPRWPLTEKTDLINLQVQHHTS